MPRFSQVDVFSSRAYAGNPVAVVHDAPDPDLDLDLETMQRFARWTNLSETTFLLPPTTAEADYRLRIFTPDRELPFAGHPTLGSAHAWLEAGGRPRRAGVLVQECGAGLVRLRAPSHLGRRLAFAAPPLLRSGPVDAAARATVAAALRIDVGEIVDSAWIDNGPGWIGILLRDAAAVLAVRPDAEALRGWDVGILGPHPPGSETAIEVRALFTVDESVVEDPVTGSLNAGIAQWLAGSRLPTAYVAAQGTLLGREGRVHIEVEAGGAEEVETVWVGGDTVTRISGELKV